jgi:hypothetical protein
MGDEVGGGISRSWRTGSESAFDYEKTHRNLITLQWLQ